VTTLQDCCATRDSMTATPGETVARGRKPGPLAQLWRGTARAGDRDVLAGVLQARIQTALAATEGCRGAYVLQRPIERGEVETLVLTLYEGVGLGSGGTCGAGLPALSDAEKRLLITADGCAVCYEVLADPGRMRLYADLSRRFPLRMMVPR